MEFEWNSIKARLNERKHGISFMEASEVFGDEYSSTVPDPYHSVNEERYLLFGMSKSQRYLVVAFTERGDTIRIISARQMTRQERKAYEK